MPYVYGMNVPPEVIYIIRHAEKPLKPPLSGVTFDGGQNEHSLLPRGWQRSGALAALFHPDFGPMRAGLRTPTALVAPSWGHPGKTAAHRSYQTIQGLSEQLGLPIASQFVQGSGPARYSFGQIPQQLLPGDTRTVIPAAVDEPEHDAGQHEHHKG